MQENEDILRGLSISSTVLIIRILLAVMVARLVILRQFTLDQGSATCSSGATCDSFTALLRLHSRNRLLGKNKIIT